MKSKGDVALVIITHASFSFTAWYVSAYQYFVLIFFLVFFSGHVQFTSTKILFQVKLQEAN